jgi:hypothetical protein
MSEKGKLKPEVTPFFGGEMSGVIPPFGTKFRMSCMIGRKSVDISWKSTSEGLLILLAIRQWNDHKEQEDCRQRKPILKSTTQLL